MGVMFNQPGVTQHDWSGGGVNKEELDLLSMITRQINVTHWVTQVIFVNKVPQSDLDGFGQGKGRNPQACG